MICQDGHNRKGWAGPAPQWITDVDQPNRDHVARHEIGHGLGLDENYACSPASVSDVVRMFSALAQQPDIS